MSVAELRLFWRQTLLRQRCLFRAYSGASSASLLYEHAFDSNFLFQNSVSDVSNVPGENSYATTECKLFPLVVRVFHSLSWRSAREIRFPEAVDKYGFHRSMHAFGIMIHIFSSAGMRREASGLLREVVFFYKEASYDMFDLLPTLMNLSGEEQSVIVFEVLMNIFAESLMLENAVDVFVQAKSIGLEPHVSSCNFLLKYLAEGNRVEFLTSLFDEMKNYGPHPNVYTYTILMDFYCKGGLWQDKADIRRANEILVEMQNCAVRPTVVTYGTYLYGICRAGDADLALDFLHDLRNRNQPLNSNCYNAVIYGFCKKGEVYKATRVLEEMKSDKISPDVYSYSILIDGFCKKGDVLKGWNLLKEMESSKIRPSIVTFSSILNGLCEGGHMEIALDWFYKLNSSGYKHDQISHNILINGYCKQGELDSANRILEEMFRHNLPPDVINWTSLIHGYWVYYLTL
uniref:Uncharacterized protein n=1 Tax=Nelumbo nucifera TaxID=4432 RepID=A0A822ZMQ7_NELNU|nr:TPA_asm: hypothetical protein HUJ06_017241 [Nelumbo nucifera]